MRMNYSRDGLLILILTLFTPNKKILFFIELISNHTGPKQFKPYQSTEITQLNLRLKAGMKLQPNARLYKITSRDARL